MFLGPLRKLTEAEVEKEVRDITTHTWPHESVLSLKNLYNVNKDHSHGCIFRTHGYGPDTIVPEVVFPGQDAPVMYASIKEMVEAGWVVD